MCSAAKAPSSLSPCRRARTISLLNGELNVRRFMVSTPLFFISYHVHDRFTNPCPGLGGRYNNTKYQYTLTAKNFCEIIFSKQIPKGIRGVGEIGYMINN